MLGPVLVLTVGLNLSPTGGGQVLKLEAVEPAVGQGTVTPGSATHHHAMYISGWIYIDVSDIYNRPFTHFDRPVTSAACSLRV